jgi:hypothetical protein
MSTYHVSFFKNLLSSDGHPFKCLQRRVDQRKLSNPKMRICLLTRKSA